MNRHLLRNWRRRVGADEYRVYSDDEGDVVRCRRVETPVATSS